MKKNYFKSFILGAFFLGTSMAGLSQTIANGTYKILNTVNNEVMTINTIAPVNSNDLIVGRAKMAVPVATDNKQLWTFTHQGNNVYKIQNLSNSSILGIKDGWCGNFGDVQATFSTSSPYVLIRVVAAIQADTYVLQIAFDSACNFGSSNAIVKAFDVDGGNAGAKIQTFELNVTNPNQIFKIVTPASLSIDTPSIINTIQISYNQSQRTVTLIDDANDMLGDVTVYDLNGRVMFTKTSMNSNNNHLDFSTLSNGIYVLNIQHNGRQSIKKVVVF